MYCRSRLVTQAPFFVRALSSSSAQIPKYSWRSRSLVAMTTAFALAGMAYSSRTHELEAKERAQNVPGLLGNLYIWGNNSQGLIFESTEKAVPIPKRINFFDETTFRDLSLGKNHAAAVDSEGNVLQWGSGFFGQGEAGQPEKTLKGKDIIQVKCGSLYSYALSKKGEVFILGKKGDPTQKTPSTILVPKELKNEKIISIEVGEHHIVALTEKGRVLSAAQDDLANKFGQLGLSHKDQVNIHEWKEVKGLEKETVKQLACGGNHTLLLTHDSLVFGFGANTFLQLVTGQHRPELATIDTPIRLAILDKKEKDKKVTQVGAGADTSFFIVDGPKSSEVFTCGSGLNGQLGTGRFTHMEGIPSAISELSNHKYYDEIRKMTLPVRIKYLTMGGKHAAAVMDTLASSEEEGDSVFIWGWNQDYQLGNGSKALSGKPIPAQPVHEISEKSHNILKLSLGHEKYQQKIICGEDTTAVFTTLRKPL